MSLFFLSMRFKREKWKTTLEWCHCVPPPKGNRQCQNSFFVSPLVNWTSFVIDLSSQQGRKRAVKRKQMLFENLFLKRSSLLLSFMSTCPGWVKWAEDILLVEVTTKFLKTSLLKKKRYDNNDQNSCNDMRYTSTWPGSLHPRPTKYGNVYIHMLCD